MPFIFQYFGTSKKHNPDATTDPTVNDDNTLGYSKESHWTNTATDNAFVCVDDTTGAAVWRKTTDIILEGGTLAGRYTGAGSGVIQQIALGNNITMTTGGVLNVSSGTATLGDGDYGDVVVSGVGTVLSIDADIVDNVKAANMAEGTLKGRASTGAGNPEDLSAAQVLGILGVEAGATADQTGAEIKTAYESEPNTNPFDDAAEAKLAGITPLADVTNAITVAAAGAVMEADTSTALMQFVLDEDSMASNSAIKLATQQSIVAYVTAQIAAALASSMTFKGGYNAATNTPDLDTSPTGVITGDTYVVTVAGTFFTTAVEVGDTLIAEIDSADAESEWTIVQANLTAATIKTSYESNADTNAFTDTEQAKLAGIEALADVTDATNVNAAGAVMESDYNAQTILAATLDNTPAPLIVGEATFVGRSTGGNVAALNATQARTILNVADGAQVNPANMLDADVTTGTDTTPKTSNAAQLKLAAQTWGGGSALSLAASTLAGRGSAAGTGAPVQIALGTNLSMSGTTLNASGGSSSGLTVVATLAALKALTKATLTTGDVRWIRGYSSDNDGGQGIWLYNSASTTTANEGTVIATNEGGSGRWFRQFSGPLNVRWFGARGDATTNDAATLQAACDLGVSQRLPVYLPSGVYRITAPVWITSTASKTAGSFYSAHIFGDGRGYVPRTTAGAATYHAETNIFADFLDGPALAMQFGRGVHIHDLGIIGLNVAPEAVTQPTATRASYVTAGCRDNRYSPYCGICIDPAAGVAPTLVGDRYPGMTYAANINGTADVRIDRVNVWNFVVGIMIQPDGYCMQGDDVHITNTMISQNVSAVAFGQDQERCNSECRQMRIDACHTAMDGESYGKMTPQPPTFSNSLVTLSYQLFAFNNQRAPLVLNSVNCETVKRIGTFGRGIGGPTQSLLISGCQFNFGFPGWTPATSVLETFSPTLITASTLMQAYTTDASYLFNFAGLPRQLEFHTSSFQGPDTDTKQTYVAYSRYMATSPRFSGCLKHCRGGGNSPLLYSDSLPRAIVLPVRINVTPSMMEIASMAARFNVIHADAEGGATWAPGSAFSLTTGTLTFTATDAAVFLVGDFLLWEISAQAPSLLSNVIPAFVVTDKVGSAITAVAVIDSTSFVTAATWTGTYGSGVYILTDEWAPGTALTATTTSGSPSLTSVSPTTILRVGDWITGAGIPTGSRVSVVAGATVTLTKNATASASGVSLSFASLAAL